MSNAVQLKTQRSLTSPLSVSNVFQLPQVHEIIDVSGL